MSLFVCSESNIFVYDFEIVPLCVSLCVKVILKPKVVFDVVNFCNLPQICIFKSWVENKYILLTWNVDWIRRIAIVSFRVKFRQITEYMPVVNAWEVSLPCFVAKRILYNFLNFFLRKQLMKIYFRLRAVSEILNNLFAPSQPRVWIIDNNSTQLVPLCKFFFGWSLGWSYSSWNIVLSLNYIHLLLLRSNFYLITNINKFIDSFLLTRRICLKK